MRIKIKKRLLEKSDEVPSIQRYSVKRKANEYSLIVTAASESDALVKSVITIRRPEIAKYVFSLFLTKEIVQKVVELNINKKAQLSSIEYTGPVMTIIIEFKPVATKHQMDLTASVLQEILKSTMELEQVVNRLAKT